MISDGKKNDIKINPGNQLKDEWLLLEATFQIKENKTQQDGACSCLNSVAATA